MKKQKPKTAAKKRQDKRKAKAKAETKEERRSWVLDRLAWVPVDQHHHHHRRHHLDISINDGDGEADGDPNVVKTKAGRVVKEVAVNILDKEEGNTISIISWNVLADAYCNRSSHKNLPLKFQRRIFDRKQRRYHVQQTLWLLTNKNDDNNNERKLALRPDLLALQEVDPPLGVAACLQEQGYGAVETATTKGGRVGRVDACGLYYRQQAWACLHHETVFLDDLATNGHALASTSNCNSMDNKEVDPTAMGSNLRGLQTSFMRKNVALLVKLQHKPSGRTLVVVVAHLFWNPAYEYVKVRIASVVPFLEIDGVYWPSPQCMMVAGTMLKMFVSLSSCVKHTTWLNEPGPFVSEKTCQFYSVETSIRNRGVKYIVFWWKEK